MLWRWATVTGIAKFNRPQKIMNKQKTKQVTQKSRRCKACVKHRYRNSSYDLYLWCEATNIEPHDSTVYSSTVRLRILLSNEMKGLRLTEASDPLKGALLPWVDVYEIVTVLLCKRIEFIQTPSIDNGETKQTRNWNTGELYEKDQ